MDVLTLYISLNNEWIFYNSIFYKVYTKKHIELTKINSRLHYQLHFRINSISTANTNPSEIQWISKMRKGSLLERLMTKILHFSLKISLKYFSVERNLLSLTLEIENFKVIIWAYLKNIYFFVLIFEKYMLWKFF